MTITIPGYTATFENAAYESDSNIIEKREDEIIRVTKIILPTRYTQPTKDDVVAYLRTKAKGASASLILPPGMVMANEDTLDARIRKLPTQILQAIRTGNPNCEEFIRAKTNTPETGNTQYLHVMYGELPANLIEASKKAGAVKSPEWYRATMLDDKLQEAQFGMQWTTRIKHDRGMLPHKDIIDLLIKYGTYGSKVFVVTDQNYDSEDVQAVIDALYGGLKTPEDVAQLPDVSDKVLEEVSSVPVSALAQTVMKQIKRQMEAMMQQIIAQQNERFKAGPQQ